MVGVKITNNHFGNSSALYKGDPPQNTKKLFIKNSVFIPTSLNFSHLQSTLHLKQYTYWDIFSTIQNSFWRLLAKMEA